MKKTVLHQIRTGEKPIPGMSYVIEADDGSIIVIDGGMTDYDGDLLVNYLKKITGSDHPTVDAWFITHAHLDHTMGCQSAALNHSHEFTVKKLIYRFPDKDFIDRVQSVVNRELPVFEKATENFTGVEKIVPSAGDRYVFGNTVFEVLFTCADLPSLEEYPNQTINDTSTVFRMTAEGQTILFLGDVQDAGDEVMIRRYGKALKSDVVQMAHHGGYGSNSALYRLVDPDILLWPVDEETFWLVLYIRDVNRMLLSSEMHVKDIILAAHGTRRMELPIRPCVAPFLPQIQEIKMKVKRSMNYADVIPDVNNPEDPAWNQADEIPVDGVYEGKKPEGVSAFLRVLWREDAVYLKASYKGETISDPGELRTDFCQNVRVHLTEELLDDITTVWNDVAGKPEFLRDLRLYPEKKPMGEKEEFNIMPGRCASFGKMTGEGYVICARIAFAKPHKKGDVIGFHTEFNTISEYKGMRSLRMTLADFLEKGLYRFSPSGVIRWKLD